jgi:hypothetical protein
MRPNPPRMITVVVAILLLLAGLALIYAQPQIDSLVRQSRLAGDLGPLLDWLHKKVVAFALLAASPLLLIFGSLLKGL